MYELPEEPENPIPTERQMLEGPLLPLVPIQNVSTNQPKNSAPQVQVNQQEENPNFNIPGMDLLELITDC